MHTLPALMDRKRKKGGNLVLACLPPSSRAFLRWTSRQREVQEEATPPRPLLPQPICLPAGNTLT